MKSLLEIYYSHKNWMDNERHPNVQIENIIDREMADEAEEYVKDLTAFKDNWKNILKDDVSGLNPYGFIAKLPYINNWIDSYYDETEESKHGFDPWKSFDGVSYYCNDGGFTDEEYCYIKHVDMVENFFCCIQESIRRYFGEDIDIIGWIKQDADTSTPTSEQTPLDKLLEEWNQGRPKRILMLLKKKGFITNNGDVYNWKIDNENDYPNKLYVYFVYVASEKFDWRTGKDKQKVPWMKFNPIFPNMAENQNAMNQYLREIKDNVFPRRASEIDSLFNW